MTIQIQNIDKKTIKSIFQQVFTERRDLFKEIVSEILEEENNHVLSAKRKALLQKIMTEDKELLQMLAK